MIQFQEEVSADLLEKAVAVVPLSFLLLTSLNVHWILCNFTKNF